MLQVLFAAFIMFLSIFQDTCRYPDCFLSFLTKQNYGEAFLLSWQFILNVGLLGFFFFNAFLVSMFGRTLKRCVTYMLK